MPRAKFPDYVLCLGGKPAVIVEAKRLVVDPTKPDLLSKQAAQVASYTSVVGCRWGVLTDGLGREVGVWPGPCQH